MSGKNQGMKIYTSLHNYPSAIFGRTEKDLLRWFSKNVSKDETWIDVGANYGYTVLALSKNIGPEGKIYAFEPVTSTFEALNETIKLNNLKNIETYCIALSDNKNLFKKRFQSTRGMLTNEDSSSKLEISLISLDSYFDYNTINKIDGIKIDVDGPELEVLIGMKSLLEIHGPKIVIEVHDKSYDSVKKFLSRFNYKQSEIIYKPFYATGESVENSNIVFLKS
jgi:FkbM family methyltransferase